jgi:hypothetical protein
MNCNVLEYEHEAGKPQASKDNKYKDPDFIAIEESVQDESSLDLFSNKIKTSKMIIDQIHENNEKIDALKADYMKATQN